MNWKTGCRVEGPGSIRGSSSIRGSGFRVWELEDWLQSLGFACLGIGVQLGVQGSEFWKLEHGLKMIYA